jgi:hypothetical protein
MIINHRLVAKHATITMLIGMRMFCKALAITSADVASHFSKHPGHLEKHDASAFREGMMFCKVRLETRAKVWTMIT